MKRQGFMEEQIIAVLKEQKADAREPSIINRI
jgi:hypothetical protein